MSVKLTNRLKLIAEKVDYKANVLDIGTDHGYIPIYLIENKICNYAIASDINDGPLQIAARNIERYNLTDKINIIKSDGLTNVPVNNIDNVIIAGMGSYQIINILKEGKEKIKNINKIIIQPMQYIEILRKWLNLNNFTVIDEELVKEDNKIYNVIVVKEGKQNIDKEIYYYIGKKLVENKDPLLKEFLEKKIKKYRDITINLKNTNNNARDKLLFYKALLKDFNNIYNKIK